MLIVAARRRAVDVGDAQSRQGRLARSRSHRGASRARRCRITRENSASRWASWPLLLFWRRRLVKAARDFAESGPLGGGGRAHRRGRCSFNRSRRSVSRRGTSFPRCRPRSCSSSPALTGAGAAEEDARPRRALPLAPAAVGVAVLVLAIACARLFAPRRASPVSHRSPRRCSRKPRPRRSRSSPPMRAGRACSSRRSRCASAGPATSSSAPANRSRAARGAAAVTRRVSPMTTNSSRFSPSGKIQLSRARRRRCRRRSAASITTSSSASSSSTPDRFWRVGEVRDLPRWRARSSRRAKLYKIQRKN